MCCLIIGADHLGCTSEYFCQRYGLKEVVHWNGRKRCSDKKVTIPKNTGRIIIFLDFISHNFVNIIKKKAKKDGVPVEFIRGKSWLEKTA